MSEYERLPDKYTPEEVLSIVIYKQDDVKYLGERASAVPYREDDNRSRKGTRIDFHGHMIRISSSRLRTFALKGIVCVKCGLEGKYFVKERHKQRGNAHDGSYHLNLYGINADGVEILMTKDHVLPKSKGGRNHIDNYQPMCFICNGKKGDKMEMSPEQKEFLLSG